MLTPYLLSDDEIHGTFIIYQKQGLLFLGKSGSGKSALAYRLISDGAKLVADDIVHINCQNFGKARNQNIGLIEIYGLGIIALNPQQYAKTAAIDHIFFNDENFDRIYASRFLNLNEKPISYSRYHFNHPFAPHYIKLFCAMLNGDIITKNSL